jgi:hypothetical protein
MNRLPALGGGPSNMPRSPTSMSGNWVGPSPSALSVIDPPSASGQSPALRISLLGSSCRCAMPAQEAGAPSDRVSAGTLPALPERRNALDQVASSKGSRLPSLPVIGMGLRDARFRSGLVTSGLAALGAISLGEVCRGAAGCGPCRDVSQRTASRRYRELTRGIAYRVYRPYWPHRNGRRRRGRGVPHRRSQ